MSSLPWPELYENQMQKITQKTNNFKQVQSRQLIKPTKWKNSQETIQAFKTTVSIKPEAGLVLMHSLSERTNEQTNKQKSPNSFQNKNRPTKKETKNENQRRKIRSKNE
jgi:hypothetical protein